MSLSLLRAKLWPLEAKCNVIPDGVILWLEGLMERKGNTCQGKYRIKKQKLVLV